MQVLNLSYVVLLSVVEYLYHVLRLVANPDYFLSFCRLVSLGQVEWVALLGLVGVVVSLGVVEGVDELLVGGQIVQNFGLLRY